jgi:small-conductance mechanosensitive channel
VKEFGTPIVASVVLLKVVLVVSILGYFGIPTTTFAALPAPDVEILSFNPAGPLLAVRPYTHNDTYWQVYFDTNRVIKEAFGEANFPVPEQHIAVRNGVGSEKAFAAGA